MHSFIFPRCALLLLLTMPFVFSGCKKRGKSELSQVNADLAEGKSLFDQLIALAPGGTVPYPFKKLVDHLDTFEPGRKVQVLIPFSRSPQKEAAEPHYFTFPRFVLAFSDPFSFTPLPPNRPKDFTLTDRIFLGYMEVANQIEVISYNDAAGRFEFQIVENYAKDQTAKTTFARRSQCLTCHKGGSPIFIAQDWQDTNANSMLSALINWHHHDDYQGSPTFQGPGHYGPQIGESERFETSVTNASRFLNAQDPWRSLCPGTSDEILKCRATLFLSVMATVGDWDWTPPPFSDPSYLSDIPRKLRAPLISSYNPFDDIFKEVITPSPSKQFFPLPQSTIPLPPPAFTRETFRQDRTLLVFAHSLHALVSPTEERSTIPDQGQAGIEEIFARGERDADSVPMAKRPAYLKRLRDLKLQITASHSPHEQTEMLVQFLEAALAFSVIDLPHEFGLPELPRAPQDMPEPRIWRRDPASFRTEILDPMGKSLSRGDTLLIAKSVSLLEGDRANLSLKVDLSYTVSPDGLSAGVRILKVRRYGAGGDQEPTPDEKYEAESDEAKTPCTGARTSGSQVFKCIIPTKNLVKEMRLGFSLANSVVTQSSGSIELTGSLAGKYPLTCHREPRLTPTEDDRLVCQTFDLSKVRKAMDGLLQENLAKRADSLSSDIFKGDTILAAVLAKLQSPETSAACCDGAGSAVSPVPSELVPLPTPSSHQISDFEAINQFCSECHQDSVGTLPALFQDQPTTESCKQFLTQRERILAVFQKKGPRPPRMPPSSYLSQLQLKGVLLSDDYRKTLARAIENGSLCRSTR